MIHLFRSAVAKVAALGVAGASAMLFASPAGAATSGQQADFYQLVNSNSGKCLAVPNSNPANGVELIQWPCSSSDDQFWALENNISIDFYRIRNLATNKCLAIPSGSPTGGVNAIQWDCNLPDFAQQWTYDSARRLRNLASDRCLTIGNASTASGAEVIQWTCTTGPEQVWLR
ncbi:RICIN domain-containing protein [Streptomyces sp. NPDC059479]|uniref:RICIN domain-containing protein n=1 Tax=Streptomyces sp. NPDC059479 TaxID=3346848 RepID=UPI00367B048E